MKYTYYKVLSNGIAGYLIYRSKLKRPNLTRERQTRTYYEYLYNNNQWCKSNDMQELSYRKRLIPMSEEDILLEMI